MNYHKVKKSDLKTININDYQEGDIINIDDRYEVYVKYTSSRPPFVTYKRASLCSQVVRLRDFKSLGSVPGVKGGRPYFIDIFLCGRGK